SGCAADRARQCALECRRSPRRGHSGGGCDESAFYPTRTVRSRVRQYLARPAPALGTAVTEPACPARARSPVGAAAEPSQRDATGLGGARPAARAPDRARWLDDAGIAASLRPPRKLHPSPACGGGRRREAMAGGGIWIHASDAPSTSLPRERGGS